MNSRKSPGIPKQERRSVDGLLLLDKPTGMTSNAALQRVKRLYRARKAGHTGSLDPLASGLLPLCFGQATKVSAYLLDADKGYVVTACWGSRTDTGDADGEVIEESQQRTCTQAALEAALVAMTGDIDQVPPMYSALKKDGKRLYELARAGMEVERAPRPVTIHALEIVAFDPGAPVIRVVCSKGTYVRTLIEDLAMRLGMLGHVQALRRTRAGPFTEDRSVTLAAVEAAAEAGTAALDALLIPVDEALVALPAVSLDKEQAWYLRHGNPVRLAGGPAAGICRVYDDQARFLGVGEALRDGRIAPKRLFTAPEPAR